MGVNLLFAVASAVGAIGQYKSSKDAAAAQKDAQKAQSRINAAQEQRQRIQAVREARIKRAMIIGQAGTQGMGQTGSGPAGGTGAVASQYGDNVAYSNTMQFYGQKASQANQAAVDAQSSASMWQTIGGFAQQATDWNKLFGGGVQRQVGQTPWNTK